jgi:type I restriction enzyme M protein
MVSVAEISDPKNDYNLNLPRYIDSTEPEDIQDIDGHLRGGIPERDIDALDRYWQVMPAVRAVLFKKFNRPSYYELTATDVKPAIFSHPEFTAFNDTATKLFTKWEKASTPLLKGYAANEASSHPKALIASLSEDLLAAFAHAPLLDHYDIYQHIMDYWAETMQDDCYLIAADGWKAAAQVREILKVKDKNNKFVWPEAHDYMKGKRRFKSDLIPALILIAHYFATERDSIEAIEGELAAVEQQLDEMREEQSGEDGLLSDVIEGDGEKQKITAKAVKARLKEIGKDPDYADERKALEDYAELLDQQTNARAKLKAAQEDLDAKLDSKYPKLTEDGIKTLVVDDKWLATLAAAVQSELDRVSQTLTGRHRPHRRSLARLELAHRRLDRANCARSRQFHYRRPPLQVIALRPAPPGHSSDCSAPSWPASYPTSIYLDIGFFRERSPQGDLGLYDLVQLKRAASHGGSALLQQGFLNRGLSRHGHDRLLDLLNYGGRRPRRNEHRVP